MEGWTKTVTHETASVQELIVQQPFNNLHSSCALSDHLERHFQDDFKCDTVLYAANRIRICHIHRALKIKLNPSSNTNHVQLENDLQTNSCFGLWLTFSQHPIDQKNPWLYSRGIKMPSKRHKMVSLRLILRPSKNLRVEDTHTVPRKSLRPLVFSPKKTKLSQLSYAVVC